VTDEIAKRLNLYKFSVIIDDLLKLSSNYTELQIGIQSEQKYFILILKFREEVKINS